MGARVYRAGRAELARRSGPAPANWERTGERDPSLGIGRDVRSSEPLARPRVFGRGKVERMGDVWPVTLPGVREGVLGDPDSEGNGEGEEGRGGGEVTPSRSGRLACRRSRVPKLRTWQFLLGKGSRQADQVLERCLPIWLKQVSIKTNGLAMMVKPYLLVVL